MIRIGKAKRDYDPLCKEKTNVPGPQHYTPKIMDKASAQLISFGKSKRSQMTYNENVPGPGQYAPNSKLGDGAPKVRRLYKTSIQWESKQTL